LWAPLKYSYNTINKNPTTPTPSPPSWQNPLGNDNQSRDVLARLIYGFRITIVFGLVLTFFSSIIGIAAGAVQGYFGGKTDLFFQRFIESWGGMPMLYILIILASIIKPSSG
jgi:microcin C transport system permease protein